ncbi:hypothetical protein, partial [Pseudomonas syringae group genomosp. 7]|uniref:hypothetical protein n=1 Tax=Pseudomonas syringae group genomosp. 7 TaxID=251699 RepID=UPI00376F57A0
KKANNTVAIAVPAIPHQPKLVKNCNISCHEAKPAPTITPINAPAISKLFFIEPPLLLLGCILFFPQ